MADNDGDSKPFHPWVVTISKNCRIKGHKTHPGFKEGKKYHATCNTCQQKSVTVQCKRNHLEIIRLNLCCPRV